MTAAQGSESAVAPDSCSLVGSEGESSDVVCDAFKASMRRAASAASMRPAARSSRIGVMSGVVIPPNVNRIFTEKKFCFPFSGLAGAHP